MTTPLEVLKSRFGYDEFRLEQEKIISSILQKKDTFALMPTGGGKSLCYQIPALIFDGLTIVLSPLISLMKDQVDALKLNGVDAAYLNSSLSDGEQRDIIERVRQGKLKLLYLAPERFFGKEQQFITFLKSVNVSLFAIDEAHCISQWGHDFRPEYLMLSKLREEFPAVPIIALTATADQQTRKDILEKLMLKNPSTFISSFNRANIHYYIEPKKNSYERLVQYLRSKPDESGIIYALSRKSVEKIAEDLAEDGFSVRPYHAGLDRHVKEENQSLFIKDKVKIIVATIAFGMGIDKSNVRYVVHMDLPKNIEGYYQETGRAGRDGLPSEALLFYSSGDVMKLKRFAQVDNNMQQTKIMLEKLERMNDFCIISTCRRKYLMNYFDEEFPDHCGSCDVCIHQYEKEDGTVIAQKALSAVVRLNERYGASFIIDFLRGSKTEKIKPEHAALKTYGIGADISKDLWQKYIKELILQGFLKQEGDPYPVLKLTEKSWRILRGEENVLFVKAVSKVVMEDAQPAYEKDLFSQLKTLRTTFAEEQNVPAYIIFSDATLIELATYLPQNLLELRQIGGFGEIKIQKYGLEFLKIVQSFCKDKALQSKISSKSFKRNRKGATSSTTRNNNRYNSKSDTKQDTLNLYKAGRSIDDIAEERGLAKVTIEGHLAQFISEGKIQVTEIVEEEKISIIADAIKQHGHLMMKTLKQELGDEFSYGEIRAVINYLNKNN